MESRFCQLPSNTRQLGPRKIGVALHKLSRGCRSMDSGKWIRELREGRSIKSGDIERISRSITDVKGSPGFYVSHSTLCDIEVGPRRSQIIQPGGLSQSLFGRA